MFVFQGQTGHDISYQLSWLTKFDDWKETDDRQKKKQKKYRAVLCSTKLNKHKLYSVPVIPMDEAGVESTPELCMLTPGEY